jgi:hypothetical protein
VARDHGQSLFADGQLRVPGQSRGEPVEQLGVFGDFERDPINVGELGRYNGEAVQLLSDAGYR